MPYANLLSLISSVFRRGEIATVVSEHNLPSSLGRMLGWRYRVQLLMGRLLYRRSDGVIAVSHAIAAELVAKFGVSASKLWIVPNPAAEGIAVQRTGNGPRQREGTIRLAVPGRLVRQKRPELCLYVAREISNRTGRRVIVDYFGSGVLEENVAKLAMRLNVEVQFHGWVDRWYEDADASAIVLLTSSIEGFGNVLVEAAAAGLPSVVSSRTLGAADACLPGLTASLIPGDSVSDYADGVEEALSMQLSAASISSWLHRFTIEHSAGLLNRVVHASVDTPEGARA